MKKYFQVVNDKGLVRKEFRQKFRAQKYCHDLNVWLGGELVWKIIEVTK